MLSKHSPISRIFRFVGAYNHMRVTMHVFTMTKCFKLGLFLVFHTWCTAPLSPADHRLSPVPWKIVPSRKGFEEARQCTIVGFTVATISSS